MRVCIQLTAGGNASIECLAYGDPAPEISWFKDSRTLGQFNDSTARLLLVSDGPYVISHVMLSHVTQHDAGNYK